MRSLQFGNHYYIITGYEAQRIDSVIIAYVLLIVNPMHIATAKASIESPTETKISSITLIFMPNMNLIRYS